MYLKENIKKITEDILTFEKEDFEDSDIFLTDIKISTDNRITILIDSFEGIKIKDCIILSKKVEENLDREKEDFELVVSSAGLDNPLKIRKQYQKNIGNQIKILTQDGNKIKGKLISVKENEIEIEPETKKAKKNKHKKEEKTEIINLNFNKIKEAKVVITF